MQYSRVPNKWGRDIYCFSGFEAKTKTSDSGKIDAYVVPVGGKFVLDEEQFLNYIKQ